MIKYLTVTVTLILALGTSFSLIARPVKRLPAHSSVSPASFIEVSGTIRNERVILNWSVKDNETADLFEVEKSNDGTNFTLAAIVFGTDRGNTDSYQFFEKAKNIKTIYRIKVVSKNKTARYSRLIEINPIP